MKRILQLFICIMPMPVKRKMLQWFFKYDIHPTAKIGLSFVYPKKLTMAKNSRIGHFNVAVNLDEMNLGEGVIIERNNWITGFPSGTNSKHFSHQPLRRSQLIMGAHSAITKGHHVDCTSPVIMEDYATIAGYNSQILTHSVNIYDNRQDSNPILLGKYSFVGTNTVVLGGSTLPAYSALGAKALLNKELTEEWKLYGGVPAKPVTDIPKDAKYFSRKDGFID